MMFKKLAITMCMAVVLAGCGGEKSVKASDAKGGEVADVYLAQITNIADAVEAVDDEKSARAAAKAIAKAAREMEALSEAVEDMTPARRAMVFASRAQDFMEPQMRLATSMQKLAIDHPEYLEIIQDEMDKMPELTK